MTMKIFASVAAVAVAGLLTFAATGLRADSHSDLPVITVYATPTCGCCKGWMQHMRENGFEVKEIYQNDLSAIRAEYDVPAEMTSCHMGVIDGYAIEGHVPASAVKRILDERPDAVGLSVPGMPIGSPGMEMPNGMKQPFEVYTFTASGPKGVFEYHN